jgi:hypothetical protein
MRYPTGQVIDVFLKKPFASNSVGLTKKRKRTVFQVWQNKIGDRFVIMENIPLGVAVFWKKYLIEVGKLGVIIWHDALLF